MISLIAILGKNRAIGRGNKLIWNIPEDLKHFKKITSGHSVIMGRKTYESIGKPLPNRINIIITRDRNYKTEGCHICHSLNEAINYAKSARSPFWEDKGHRNAMSQEIFIIGGGEIYRQAISLSDKLYLTMVEDLPNDADTFFPNYSKFKNIVSREEHEYKGLRYKFIELTR